MKMKFEIEASDLTDIEVKKIESEIKKIIGPKLTEFKSSIIDIEEIDKDLIYMSKPVNYELPVDEWLEEIEKSEKRIAEINDAAKASGKFAGRILKFPMGDGYAFYQILIKNGDNVLISLITGLGDDWSLPEVGPRGTINLARATKYLMRGSDERSFGF